MCLLKRVIRDITNPQYWAKLSLNPLMIAVFFWCAAQVFINPFGVGGTPGVEGVGLFLQTEAWDPDLPPHLCPFSEVAVPMRRCPAGPRGWVHAGPADAHPVVR